MKKKQADFQKQKLRVGRQLPKGQNVTDTSFRTGRISVPNQSKPVSGQVLKELLNHLGHCEVSKKKDNLQKLNNYVIKRKVSLCLEFHNILKRVGRILLEDDCNIRLLAITVIHTCLTLLSDAEMKFFSKPLTFYLQCMMTHINKSVRLDSLKFFDKILETHPKVVCQAVDVLSHMLNMISSLVPIQSKSKAGKKRKLDEHINSQITSQDWRFEVLSRVLSFLETMLEEDKIQVDETEQEIHWDGEKPLYLPLYTHGGLKPAKLKTSCDNSMKNLKDIAIFKTFMYDIVPLLSQILKAETSFKQRAPLCGKDQKPLLATLVDIPTARLLTVIVQILCCFGEMPLKYRALLDDSDDAIKIFLGNVVHTNLLVFFPFVKEDLSNKRQNYERVPKNEVECMQLNLAICYSYAMFVLDTEKASLKMEENIMSFVKDMFGICSRMYPKSISYTLKLGPLLMKSASLNDAYKNAILLGLYGILELRQLPKKTFSIYEFFMDISLNFEYQNLLKSDGMETWFRLVMKKLYLMLDSGTVDKKFLKYVRLLSARKYEYFIGIVNSIFPKEFLELLSHPDEDFQSTIVHLISSLDRITADFFQDLCETLSNKSFSPEIASELIHFLQARFSKSNVKIQDQAHFVQFLLNLAFDTTMLSEPSFWESTLSSPMLMDFMQSCHFDIQPFEGWKRHLKIADICIDYLSAYLHNENNVRCILVFIKEFLVDAAKLPIHSVISLLKLRNKIKYYEVRDIDTYIYEVIFSSLMYLSFILKNKMENQEMYAASEVQKNLCLERRDIRGILNIMNSSLFNFGESELYHVLRVILFLTKINLFVVNDGQLVFSVIEKVNDTCQRSDLLRPLWLNILKFFQFI